MRIIVKVTSSVAAALHQRSPPTGESRELSRVAAELDVALEPLHPGAVDADSMTYFKVEAPDSEAAQRVISRLQASRCIEAAYSKPQEGAPKLSNHQSSEQEV